MAAFSLKGLGHPFYNKVSGQQYTIPVLYMVGPSTTVPIRMHRIGL